MFAIDIFIKVYIINVIINVVNLWSIVLFRFFFFKMSSFAMIERRQRILSERGDKPLAFSVFKWNEL